MNRIDGAALGHDVGRNDAQRIQVVLERYAPGIPLKYRIGALRESAISGQQDILEVLLHHYGETLPISEIGEALELASEEGHNRLVRTLISRYGEAIPEDNRGGALEIAVANGHLDIAKSLMTRYGDSIHEYFRGTALEEASRKGNLPMVEAILSHYGQSIHQFCKSAALEASAFEGHVAVAQTLIDRYRDEIPTLNIDMAFRLAAGRGHNRMVELFLENFTERISPEQAGWGLIRAGSGSFSCVVETVLHQYGEKISAAQRENALRLSILQARRSSIDENERKGHLEIIDILQNGPYLQRIREELACAGKDRVKEVFRLFEYATKADISQRKALLQLLKDGMNQEFLGERAKLMDIVYKNSLPIELTEVIFELADVRVRGIAFETANELYKLKQEIPNDHPHQRRGISRGANFQEGKRSLEMRALSEDRGMGL